MLLAILLMLADHESTWFHRVRETAAVIVTPIDYLVDIPLNMVEEIVTDVSSRRGLIQENVQLKAQVILLQARLQKTLAIQSENAQLKQLMQSSTRVGGGRVLQAQILAVSPDPYLHQYIIDKGKSEGVYSGQPVLDAYGIMGQVIQVGPVTSRVLLLTDSDSAIPVEDGRSGVRAIAEGDNRTDGLVLSNVTETTDVQKGDLLIASGLGGRYPYGYPVGTITSIKEIPGEQFLQIDIAPAAHIDQSRLVLLIWTDTMRIDPQVQRGLDQAVKRRKKMLPEEGT